MFHVETHRQVQGLVRVVGEFPGAQFPDLFRRRPKIGVADIGRLVLCAVVSRLPPFGSFAQLLHRMALSAVSVEIAACLVVGKTVVWDSGPFQTRWTLLERFIQILAVCNNDACERFRKIRGWVDFDETSSHFKPECLLQTVKF